LLNDVNMGYKCAIVDDEPLALDILENYIQQTAYLQLIARTNTLSAVHKLVDEKEVDLVLLDVNIRGVHRESIRQLLKKNCHFVLVTAYPITELKSIGLQSKQGYLAKPASYKKFIQEIKRILNN
jgi:two-component SAPR family response regulator